MRGAPNLARYTAYAASISSCNLTYINNIRNSKEAAKAKGKGVYHKVQYTGPLTTGINSKQKAALHIFLQSDIHEHNQKLRGKMEKYKITNMYYNLLSIII